MNAIATVLAAAMVAAAVVVHAASSRYSFHYDGNTYVTTRLIRFDHFTGETKVCVDFSVFSEAQCVDRYFDASGRVFSYTLPGSSNAEP